MHSIDLNGNVCINLNDFNEISNSIRLRNKIDYFIDKLECPKEVSNFSVTFIFKNGFRYYISNVYLWAIPYLTEGYWRGDKDHQIFTHEGSDFFIQSDENYDDMQLPIIDVLENRYSLHTVFAMIRRCHECDLIIEAYSSNRIIDPSSLYYNIKIKFELFISNFIDEMQSDIVKDLPSHSMFSIISNKNFRRDVITQNKKDSNYRLTVREKECLTLLSMGFSIKNVASDLFISTETVASHAKSIRRKLGCKNITQAAVSAHTLGLINI